MHLCLFAQQIACPLVWSGSSTNLANLALGLKFWLAPIAAVNQIGLQVRCQYREIAVERRVDRVQSSQFAGLLIVNRVQDGR